MHFDRKRLAVVKCTVRDCERRERALFLVLLLILLLLRRSNEEILMKFQLSLPRSTTIYLICLPYPNGALYLALPSSHQALFVDSGW